MAAINCILHPHHVSLSRHPYTLSSLLHQFQDRIDPYYEVDGSPSHKNLVVPRFNVCETEFAYLLDGELPGVSDKQQISVEWLENQTLFIRGAIKPEETERESEFPRDVKNDLDPRPVHKNNGDGNPASKIHNGLSNIAPLKDEREEFTGPRHWLNERRLGAFERSFTFPTQIGPDEMKASLANGLLKIVVPKKLGANSVIKRIQIL